MHIIYTLTYIFHVYTYIHTRTHKQRILFLRIILTPGGPRGPLMLVILFTLYDPTKDSRKYRKTAHVVFEPPWWSSEKFYATVISTNSHFVLFSLSRFTSPFVNHAFLFIPINTPSPLIATLPRAEKRLQAKLH